MNSGYLVACTTVVLAGALCASPAAGQQAAGSMRYSGDTGQVARPGGVLPALWNSPVRDQRGSRFSPLVDAHGESVVVPASYCPAPGSGYPAGPYGGCPPGCSPGFCDPAVGAGPYGGYPPAGTCPPFPGDDSYDLIGAGAMGIDQCGPHFFDARMEILWMSRKTAFDQNVNFTIDNQDPNNIVLSSGSLDYDTEPGFRIMGRYDIGAMSFVEFGYWGVHDFELEATAVDNDPPSPAGEGDLYSFYSGVFVTDPPQFVPANIVVPGGPNAQTERSTRQSIRMNSDLQNAEISCRRYWVGYHPRISGTVLLGARYTRLKEGFAFLTQGSESLVYDLRTENDLVGGQIGGDMWVCLRQGVRLGSEMKLGLYNNRYQVDTNISASSNANLIANPISNRTRDDKAAWIFEWSIDMVFDILPSWSVRTGFETVTINELALTGNNFNTGTIYTNQDPNLVPPFVPFINDSSKAVYTGFHLGMEYIY